jgi:hypothetical protein
MMEVAEIVAADTTDSYDSRAADLRPCGAGEYSSRRTSSRHEEIARLAYCQYESRGRQDGHDIEDWLRAERELAFRESARLGWAILSC